jgi:hypothetical protein
MFRRATSAAAKKAFKEIFGKDPVEAADKAKQAADKVSAALKSKKPSKSQLSHVSAQPFSSPVSFGSPFVDNRDKKYELNYESNDVFKTPIKTPKSDSSEPKLSKIDRHQSVVAKTPQSYAPIFGDTTPVNQKLEFL